MALMLFAMITDNKKVSAAGGRKQEADIFNPRQHVFVSCVV